jgi:hypothetical protein
MAQGSKWYPPFCPQPHLEPLFTLKTTSKLLDLEPAIIPEPPAATPQPRRIGGGRLGRDPSSCRKNGLIGQQKKGGCSSFHESQAKASQDNLGVFYLANQQLPATPFIGIGWEDGV